MEALVGVISISPFESRALILPVEPKVKQRSKRDLPTSAISWLQTQVDMAGREDGLDVDVVLSRVAR